MHTPSAHSMCHATGWPATIRAGSRSRCCSRASRTRRPSSSTPTCSSSTTTSPTSSPGSSSSGMTSWRCRAAPALQPRPPCNRTAPALQPRRTRPATAPHQLCTRLARTSHSFSTRCTHAVPTPFLLLPLTTLCTRAAGAGGQQQQIPSRCNADPPSHLPSHPPSHPRPVIMAPVFDFL